MASEFRAVAMPDGIPGALFLSSMPGRLQPMDRALADIAAEGVDRIISLTPVEEIRAKSPLYARLLRANRFPCPVQFFPIPDFEDPEDPQAFLSLVGDMRDSILAGERLLVHCAAGFGRTGTVATCVLVALGVEAEQARQLVRDAGARPEYELVDWLNGDKRAD